MSRSVMIDGLATILSRWQLTDPENLCETSIARLWRVQQSDGTPVVLKLYRQLNRGNEAAGVQLLQSWSNSGAVHIFQDSGAAVLMQWLNGPSLGDIARAGDPAKADQLLCTTARRLHRTPVHTAPDLQPLQDVFEALFQLKYSTNCQPALRQDMQRATDLARRLLNAPPSPVPLHGDLHHDNVILTAAGPCVIDAKGYVGDPAFELANALRHPKGLSDLVRDQGHIVHATKLYAKAMNVPPQRLIQWAAAKCALSIAWRAKRMLDRDKESDLLRLLLDQANQ